MTEQGSRHTQQHQEKVLNPSICSSLCSLDFDKIKYQEDQKEVNLVELTVTWDCQNNMAAVRGQEKEQEMREPRCQDHTLSLIHI